MASVPFAELGLDITFLDVTQRWYTCDNNWDAFLYETGYVGLGIIFCLLCTPLLIALRTYIRLPRPEKNLSGVLFIALAGFYFLLMSVAGYSLGTTGVSGMDLDFPSGLPSAGCSAA